MARNIELLESTMRHIIDCPESWDQSQWFCNTTACFAGHVALSQGFRPPVGPLEGWENSLGVCYSREGDMLTAKLVAQDALGLDEDEAALLFSSTNTLDELQLIVKGLVDGQSVSQITLVLCSCYNREQRERNQLRVDLSL